MIGEYVEEGRQRLLARGIQKVRGTESGTSVRANRAYIDSIQLETRMLDAVEHPDTAITFLGRRFDTPVMSAALSGLNNICPHGMAETARGIAAAGACMWAGIGQQKELHEICQAGAPTVKIIKPYKDTDLILEKLRQAEEEGCFATGMDISFFYGAQIGDRMVADQIVAPKSSAEMKRIMDATRLPFIFKGVLSLQDAKKALDLGAAAIVVSSHSGSVMDYSVPPLRILPAIAKLVRGRIPILADGDIRRGSDVYKALALGADGVLVGRALMAGLEMDGAEGVTKVVRGITDELRRIIGQTGCSRIADIDPSVLWMSE